MPKRTVAMPGAFRSGPSLRPPKLRHLFPSDRIAGLLNAGRGSLIGYRVSSSTVTVIEEQPTFEVGESVTLPSDASDGVVVSDIGGDEVRVSSNTRRNLRGAGRIAVPGFINVPRDSLVLANFFPRR